MMSVKNIYKKFLEESMSIGIYAFLFLLPWQTRLILRQNEIGYLEVSVYVVDIIIVLLAAVNLWINNFQFSIFKFQSIFNFQISKLKKPAFWILAFTLWSIISILWAADKILALQHVFWLLLAVGLGWLVYKAENIKKIIFWFCAGLIAPAWLAIWQFATQSTFSNKWLGLAVHRAALGGTSVVETFVEGRAFRWLRAYGSFDHPNILGAVMVIGLLFAITGFLRTVRNGSKNSWADSPLIGYIALVSFAAACFFSFSRSAWLGLLIGIVSIGFFLLRNLLRNSAVNYNYLKMVAVIVVTFLMLGVTYKDVVLVRTDGAARLEKKSLDDRALYFQQAKETIKQNLIVGVGTGNYISSLKKENPNNPSWNYQPVHNVFMLIWAELGFVGLLTFMVLYGTIIMRAYKNNPLGFCLLLALLPAMFLDHWLWGLHFGLIFSGFVVGIIFNKRCKFTNSPC